ncbi:MAG: tRNA (adenosine(37)-N6)-dimethylallyltransferase MiaA [Planctomycetota bacterium]|nr:tRNA (adenosine(37)-N6)-dimethylallyltransferase MiaA [Planctomycetota bacterium]
MTGNSSLLVILGATGSGKSALAIALARKCHAEILSIDSMQVYQGMDIGTAKPSLAERYEIPHHLLDWVRPDEVFSVARFVALADEEISHAKSRGVPLIATGGTPLYYKALFEGLFEGPASDESMRDELRELDGPELHAQLAAVDPAAAERIHVADQRRLIRAIEVHRLTGQPISALQKQWASGHPPRHEATWIGLQWDREALNRRINARVKDMMEAGWLEEVRSLLHDYPSLSKTAAEATGYKELIDHLLGRVSLDDAVEQIKIATRQLARRQMKWFKRFGQVHWLAGNAALEDNVNAVLSRWRSL